MLMDPYRTLFLRAGSVNRFNLVELRHLQSRSLRIANAFESQGRKVTKTKTDAWMEASSSVGEHCQIDN